MLIVGQREERHRALTHDGTPYILLCMCMCFHSFDSFIITCDSFVYFFLYLFCIFFLHLFCIFFFVFLFLMWHITISVVMYIVAIIEIPEVPDIQEGSRVPISS